MNANNRLCGSLATQLTTLKKNASTLHALAVALDTDVSKLSENIRFRRQGYKQQIVSVESLESKSFIVQADGCQLQDSSLPNFLPGESVLICKGPLSGLSGMISTTTCGGGLIVNVKILKRELKVEIQANDVCPLDC